jgi:hypothetical protein
VKRVEAALAIAAFAALCAAVLSVAPQSAEPDDGAYRASIVAMTEGHFLTLSTAQAETLARKLGDNPAAPPNQWVELADGRYISQKNPNRRATKTTMPPMSNPKNNSTLSKPSRSGPSSFTPSVWGEISSHCSAEVARLCRRACAGHADDRPVGDTALRPNFSDPPRVVVVVPAKR